ncbi:hypothetical protein BCR37DRAFT_377180, partial [Protomyces lactucae-debilis]
MVALLYGVAIVLAEQAIHVPPPFAFNLDRRLVCALYHVGVHRPGPDDERRCHRVRFNIPEERPHVREVLGLGRVV